MKRLDFLKSSLAWRNYTKTAWMVSAFSVTREDPEAWKKDPYTGRIVCQEWGYSFVNQNGELESIEDAPKGKPIFAMLEVIEIDPTWIINLSQPVRTFIGSLMSNAILLVENFGSKIPFMVENIEIADIEKFVIEHRDELDPKNPNSIKLSEYLGFGQSVEYMKTLSNLSVYSLTEKTMSTPPGLKEFKASLLKEYEGKLDDPVMLAAFEKKLLDFYKEYIKDDPSYGKLIGGKILGNGIRKLFLTSGAEGGMGKGMVPIVESLQDGVPLSPKNFAAVVNGSRGGSYFRAVDTVKGGVSFKIALRVLSMFEVVSGDCGSLYGVDRLFTKFTLPNLVGRTLAGSSKGLKIENINEAGNYLGKKIKVRSPVFCLSKGMTFCEVCAGPRLSRFKKGLGVPATEMTSAILAASMAAMHKNTTTTAKIDYSTCYS